MTLLRQCRHRMTPRNINSNAHGKQWSERYRAVRRGTMTTTNHRPTVMTIHPMFIRLFATSCDVMLECTTTFAGVAQWQSTSLPSWMLRVRVASPAFSVTLPSSTVLVLRRPRACDCHVGRSGLQLLIAGSVALERFLTRIVFVEKSQAGYSDWRGVFLFTPPLGGTGTLRTASTNDLTASSTAFG